jgi:hypothetical protein
MENPGDCSPSLSVVSKMLTMSMALSHTPISHGNSQQIKFIIVVSSITWNYIKPGSTGFTGCGKKALFCHSERSEESLFDLSIRKETRRDSSLRSE